MLRPTARTYANLMECWWTLYNARLPHYSPPVSQHWSRDHYV